MILGLFRNPLFWDIVILRRIRRGPKKESFGGPIFWIFWNFFPELLFNLLPFFHLFFSDFPFFFSGVLLYFLRSSEELFLICSGPFILKNFFRKSFFIDFIYGIPILFWSFYFQEFFGDFFLLKHNFFWKKLFWRSSFIGVPLFWRTLSGISFFTFLWKSSFLFEFFYLFLPRFSVFWRKFLYLNNFIKKFLKNFRLEATVFEIPILFASLYFQVYFIVFSS